MAHKPGFCSYGKFSCVCFFLYFRCMCYYISLFLVVSTSAINCLERLFSKMTYYVSSGTLNHNSTQINPILLLCKAYKQHALNEKRNIRRDSSWCALIWLSADILNNVKSTFGPTTAGDVVFGANSRPVTKISWTSRRWYIHCAPITIICIPEFPWLLALISTVQQTNYWILKQASNGLWGSAGLKMPIHAHSFRWAILTGKVGQTDLGFGVRSGFISRSVHTDYRSLCAVAMLCATPVNTQTAFWPAYMNSSASWARNPQNLTEQARHNTGIPFIKCIHWQRHKTNLQAEWHVDWHAAWDSATCQINAIVTVHNKGKMTTLTLNN